MSKEFIYRYNKWEKTMTEKRNYGLDVYKILIMFLVIAFHFSDHGVTQLVADAPLNFSWFLLASSRIWGGVMQLLLYIGYRIFSIM